MPGWAKWGLAVAVACALVYLGWHVSYVLVTLHILVCFILIVVIMLQSGSAADLAGAFGGAGSQTAFGPRSATTFLSRATTWCAIVFMMSSLALSLRRAPVGALEQGQGSILEQTKQSAPAPAKPNVRIPVQKPAPPPVQPQQRPQQKPQPK